MNAFDVFKGVRVVDFSQGMAGPYCGYLLAQHGADVVKVEPPAGDWMRSNGKRFGDHSAMSIHANGGKRSLALDLKAPGALEVARTLAAGADVLIENSRPGVMKRLGLGYEAVTELRSDVIYLSVTGFGQSGPYAQRPGTDTALQAYSGLTIANVGTNGVPHRVGILVPDMVTALYAFQSVAVALYGKAMGRGGMFLDVSLTQAMVAFQGYMLIQAVIEGDRPEVLAVPSGVYPTADGWVSLAVINEPQWPRLAAAIGRPDLVRDERFSTRERRGANHVLLNGIVGEAIKNQGTASLLARLQQSDVPHSRLNGYRELLDDEHIRHTGAVEWLDQPGIGCIPLAMTPGHDRGARASVKAPAVGEHSFEILRELGLTSSEIDTLASTKAVVRPATAILEG